MVRWKRFFLLSALLTLLAGEACADGPALRSPNWLFILQDADIQKIAGSAFSLVVMDATRDGTDETQYPEQEIQNLRSNGIIPICYLSIGEAEDYRFYWEADWWRRPPAWLGRANPEWPDNYKVRYWERDWQAIVFSCLDRILDQGFAGVYLDIVDAFEHWSDPQNGESFHLPEEVAARRMIAFVETIAHTCREEKARPYFYIVPQNGERLLEFDDDGSYLATISGIGAEDLWYDGVTPQPSEETTCRLGYLSRVATAGKPVFSVDYVDDGSGYADANRVRIEDYWAKATAAGFIPYAASVDRSLDCIVRIPGLQP